jgi:hypothetical protein
VLRDCVTEDNDGAGYQLAAVNLDSSSEPVSIMLENCQSKGDEIAAFLAEVEPWRTCRFRRKGGFMTIRNCRFSRAGEATVKIINKPQGVIDMRFENCVFDKSPGCVAISPDVVLESKTLDLTPVGGVVFDNVDIHRADANWISAMKFPWSAGEAVSGRINIHVAGKRIEEMLDGRWREKTLGTDVCGIGLEPCPFTAESTGSVVDLAPGRMVPLSPVKLRFHAEAVAYANAGCVSFSAYVHRVNKRPLAGQPFKVFDMAGRLVCTLSAPDEKESQRMIQLPGKGVYRIFCEVEPHALVFTGCDAPFGIVPPQSGEKIRPKQRGTINVYRSEGAIYFPAREGRPTAFVCGGGGTEKISAVLRNASGGKVAEWRNCGSWGFCRTDAVPEGLWSVELSSPDSGCVWEDSYIALLGKPTVFFLTGLKYWKDHR